MPPRPSSVLPGATHQSGVTTFRVWAPEAREVAVVFEDASQAPLHLDRCRDGYFVGTTAKAPPGTLYKLTVDDTGPWPDPCSRYQPQSVHGPSMVVDPAAFPWSDADWRGVRIEGQVIYELHVGAFTPEGTFDAAAEKLPYLRELGITLIEVMPIAEFPGRWNWGYDGVQLFAPCRVYGDYEAFKRFVDRAHEHGLAVILDVVYNHFGPDGNYLRCFSPHYFSSGPKNDWGDSLNFDGPHAGGMRDLAIGNAEYWVREFHLDGLRLDATQSIDDRGFEGRPHVLAEVVQAARDAAHPREIIVVAENEPQRSEHLLPADQGGFGLDGMWNDDYHHAAKVALTGTRDGYFHDYTGRAQEFLSCVRHGFLYQGQWYHWQKQTRGSAARGIPPSAYIIFLQNHDQVGNTFIGDRVHSTTAPARYRALMALTLLAPQTPMLFMGQEFACSRRFMFFADHDVELATLVHGGRRDFLKQFRAYADADTQTLVANPAAESTFLDSKLDWNEARKHAHAVRFHRDLIGLRRTDPVLSRANVLPEGATLTEHALVLRWFDDVHGDRLLIVNLERELALLPAPEPLLAPPRHREWTLTWSSEATAYGGHGVINTADANGRGTWRLPGQCAVLLVATQEKDIDQ